MNGSVLSHSVVTLISAAVGLACSDGQVSIGEQNPVTETKTGLQAFVGQWDGYIQAHTFIDGSDRVRLSVGDDGKGTIRFGQTELWPKATDPNAKFPPDFPQCTSCSTDLPEVWDGFAYTLNGLQFEANRLRGTAGSTEIFKNWCELQTSHHYYDLRNDKDSYTCSTCRTGGDDVSASDYCSVWGAELCATELATGGSVAFPNPPVLDLCERDLLCKAASPTCECDPNGCRLAAPAQDAALDATVTDQSMIMGTLALATRGLFTNYTIVLNRQ